jgi:hypothetical protein
MMKKLRNRRLIQLWLFASVVWLGYYFGYLGLVLYAFHASYLDYTVGFFLTRVMPLGFGPPVGFGLLLLIVGKILAAVAKRATTRPPAEG